MEKSAALGTFAETDDIPPMGRYRRLYIIFVLLLIYTCSSIDRFIISVLLEPIKHSFSLSDAWLGILAGAFAAFYLLAGIPLGLAVDRFNRRSLLAICLFLWSIMTFLCGLAHNAVMLLLARIGVGIGEAGGGPASMSMMSDLFPPEKRAFWMSVLYLAAPLGAMIAIGAGAWIAAEYGWRTAFMLAAAPGFLLVPLLLLTVKEPVRGQNDTVAEENIPSLMETLSFVWSQRSLRHILIGVTLTGFVSNGLIAWMTSFLVRVHQFSLKEAGTILGFCLGPLAAVGILGFGYITDKLGERDVRWRGRIIAVSAAGLSLFVLLTILAPTHTLVITSMILWFLLGAGIWGPAYALAQSLVHIRMRGVTMSLTYGAIAAGAISPHTIGLLSDYLAPSLGIYSLRYAMLIVSVVAPWALLHFILAIRSLPDDLQKTSQAH